MELQTYVEESAKTLKPLGSQSADCAHMVIGMYSEINELQDAIAKGDHVNVLEEIGDFCWYLFNYARLRSVQYTMQLNVGTFTFQHLVYHSSLLSDTVKKFLIYNKEIDVALERQQIQQLVEIVSNYSYFDPLSGQHIKVDIYQAFDKNIEKLNKVRYKNATYSDQAAQNRDLDAERKALES